MNNYLHTLKIVKSLAPSTFPLPDGSNSVTDFILAGSAKYYRLNTVPKLGEGHIS